MSTNQKRNKRTARRKTIVREIVVPRPARAVIKRTRAAPRRQRNPNSNIGSMVGTFIGSGARAMFKAITGFGDYSVQSNTLMTGGMSPPEIVNSSSNGGVIVRHREYLADLQSTADFTLSTFPLNPGLDSSFPWLSHLADGFEQYRFRGMIFEFKSTSSDAVLSTSASTSLGVVVMATQYNSLDADFSDKRTMENHQYANAAKPSLTFYHPIECAKSQTSVDELYVRHGDIPTGADLRLYDLGKFSVATMGMQNVGGVIGEIWCTYEIELFKPKIVDVAGITLDTAHYSGQDFTAAAPLGVSRVENFDSIGLMITNTVITMPKSVLNGRFWLSVNWTGTSPAAFTSPVISFAGCTATPYFYNGVNTVAGTPAGASATAVDRIFVLDVHAAGPIITFGTAGVLPTVAAIVDITLTRMNGNVKSKHAIEAEPEDPKPDPSTISYNDFAEFLATRRIGVPVAPRFKDEAFSRTSF
jgi:hypothetical protein